MNVLLDTNILTRWVNKRDSQHLEAVECLRMLRTSGHVPALVPQNLYEFWVVATRPIAVNGLGMTTGTVTINSNAAMRTVGTVVFRIPNANHCPNSRESDCKNEKRPRG